MSRARTIDCRSRHMGHLSKYDYDDIPDFPPDDHFYAGTTKVKWYLLVIRALRPTGWQWSMSQYMYLQEIMMHVYNKEPAENKKRMSAFEFLKERQSGAFRMSILDAYDDNKATDNEKYRYFDMVHMIVFKVTMFTWSKVTVTKNMRYIYLQGYAIPDFFEDERYSIEELNMYAFRKGKGNIYAMIYDRIASKPNIESIDKFDKSIKLTAIDQSVKISKPQFEVHRLKFYTSATPDIIKDVMDVGDVYDDDKYFRDDFRVLNNKMAAHVLKEIVYYGFRYINNVLHNELICKKRLDTSDFFVVKISDLMKEYALAARLKADLTMDPQKNPYSKNFNFSLKPLRKICSCGRQCELSVKYCRGCCAEVQSRKFKLYYDDIADSVKEYMKVDLNFSKLAAIKDSQNVSKLANFIMMKQHDRILKKERKREREKLKRVNKRESYNKLKLLFESDGLLKNFELKSAIVTQGPLKYYVKGTGDVEEIKTIEIEEGGDPISNYDVNADFDEEEWDTETTVYLGKNGNAKKFRELIEQAIARISEDAINLKLSIDRKRFVELHCAFKLFYNIMDRDNKQCIQTLFNVLRSKISSENVTVKDILRSQNFVGSILPMGGTWAKTKRVSAMSVFLTLSC
jgi:hypothetical protein